MTTKIEKFDHGVDLQGLPLNNAPIQALSALPATTYARIVYLTTIDGGHPANHYYGYDTNAAAWIDLGSGGGSVSDTAYAGSWDGVTTVAPSKNAVYDKIEALAAAKADLASPTFTGDPKAPTPATSDNDTSIATTAFTQAAIAAYIAAQDVEVFKGAIDCSTNPNYPAADAGNVYRVSVAGRIGGASGPKVEVNDRLECLVDSSAAGNHATVGANWLITQVNIDGAVTGPTSSTSGNLASFNGTGGTVVQDSGVAAAGLTHKYAADIGDGSTEDIVVTHSLGTRDVDVTVREVASPYAVHDVYWEATSTSTVTLFFPAGSPPASASLRAIVVG